MRRGYPRLLVAALFLSLTATLASARSTTWSRTRSGPIILNFHSSDREELGDMARDQIILLHVLQEYFPMPESGLVPLEIYVVNAKLPKVYNSMLESEDEQWPPLAYYRFPDRDVIVSPGGLPIAQINSQIVAWYLAHWGRKIPLWINVAMQAEMGSLHVENGEVSYGASLPEIGGGVRSAINAVGPAATSGGFDAVVAAPSAVVASNLAPMAAVLAVTDPANPGPYFDKYAQPFPAECTLVVHYLLNQPKPNQGEALRRYIELQSAGRYEPMEAFREAFGYDGGEIIKRVRTFIRTGGMNSSARTFPIPAVATPKVQKLDDRETAYAEATLLIADAKLAEARKLLKKADPIEGSVTTLGMIAQMALSEKRYDEALHEAEKALEAAPNLGWLHLLAAKAGLGLGAESQSPEGSARIADHLREGARLDSRLRRSVQIYMSEVGSFSTVTRADLKLASSIVQRFPDEPEFIAGLAMVESRAGHHASASKRLAQLLDRLDLAGSFRQFLHAAAERERLPGAMEEVDALAQEGKGDEAIRRYDALTEEQTKDETREQLKAQRATVVWTVRWTETAILANAGNMAQVRINLAKLVETAPTEAQREQAKRVLANLPPLAEAEKK